MSDDYRSDSSSLALESAYFRVKYLIQIYTLAQEMRPSVLSVAFGKDINVTDVQWLIGKFEDSNFSSFPKVEKRARLALGGARSLYVPELNVIYLAEDFADAADRDELVKALLQEIVNAVKFATE